MVQRVHALLRERLALVSWLGWIAHVHDQRVRLVFRTGIMLSIARTVRICASSKTATSTLCRPRPKPFSRAPNMMRLPDVNVISCWPFALRMRSTYLPSIGLCSISHMSANVSSLVRVWWAVQMAFRFGVSIA